MALACEPIRSLHGEAGIIVLAVSVTGVTEWVESVFPQLCTGSIHDDAGGAQMIPQHIAQAVVSGITTVVKGDKLYSIVKVHAYVNIFCLTQKGKEGKKEKKKSAGAENMHEPTFDSKPKDNQVGYDGHYKKTIPLCRKV